MSEITQEQAVKDPVKIAEFIHSDLAEFRHDPWTIEQWDQFCWHTYEVATLEEWLPTAKAEVAMMDKLGEEKPYFHLISKYRPKENDWLFIIADWYSDPEVTLPDIIGQAPTRNEALKLAILEMLELK